MRMVRCYSVAATFVLLFVLAIPATAQTQADAAHEAMVAGSYLRLRNLLDEGLDRNAASRTDQYLLTDDFYHRAYCAATMLLEYGADPALRDTDRQAK